MATPGPAVNTKERGNVAFLGRAYVDLELKDIGRKNEYLRLYPDDNAEVVHRKLEPNGDDASPLKDAINQGILDATRMELKYVTAERNVLMRAHAVREVDSQRRPLISQPPKNQHNGFNRSDTSRRLAVLLQRRTFNLEEEVRTLRHQVSKWRRRSVEAERNVRILESKLQLQENMHSALSMTPSYVSYLQQDEKTKKTSSKELVRKNSVQRHSPNSVRLELQLEEAKHEIAELKDAIQKLRETQQKNIGEAVRLAAKHTSQKEAPPSQLQQIENKTRKAMLGSTSSYQRVRNMTLDREVFVLREELERLLRELDNERSTHKQQVYELKARLQIAESMIKNNYNDLE